MWRIRASTRFWNDRVWNTNQSAWIFCYLEIQERGAHVESWCSEACVVCRIVRVMMFSSFRIVAYIKDEASQRELIWLQHERHRRCRLHRMPIVKTLSCRMPNIPGAHHVLAYPKRRLYKCRRERMLHNPIRFFTSNSCGYNYGPKQVAQRQN